MDTRAAPVPDAGGLPFRELPRLAEIARVAAAKGWAHYAERLGLARGGEPAAGAARGTEHACNAREVPMFGARVLMTEGVRP